MFRQTQLIKEIKFLYNICFQILGRYSLHSIVLAYATTIYTYGLNVFLTFSRAIKSKERKFVQARSHLIFSSLSVLFFHYIFDLFS